MKLPGCWIKLGRHHVRALFSRQRTFAERFAFQYDVTVRRYGWLVIEIHEWNGDRVRFKLFFGPL
jgi:hypothetical protein